MQGEYNSEKQLYAAIAVPYHQGSKIRHGGRLIGTERAGNLLSARARVGSFSGTSFSSNGKRRENLFQITDNHDCICRIGSFGPHPTQSVSIAFRDAADQLLRSFSRPRSQFGRPWSHARPLVSNVAAT